MGWTDDPLADFDRYEAEQRKRLERRPICSICGEHIQGEFCYAINLQLICERCLDENYTVPTSNFIDDGEWE